MSDQTSAGDSKISPKSNCSGRYQETLASVVFIQKLWRGCRARRQAAELKREKAATTIQVFARSWLHEGLINILTYKYSNGDYAFIWACVVFVSTL